MRKWDNIELQCEWVIDGGCGFGGLKAVSCCNSKLNEMELNCAHPLDIQNKTSSSNLININNMIIAFNRVN